MKTLRGYLRGAEFLRIKNHIENFFFVCFHTFLFFGITFKTHNTADYSLLLFVTPLHTHTYRTGTISYWVFFTPCTKLKTMKNYFGKMLVNACTSQQAAPVNCQNGKSLLRSRMCVRVGTDTQYSERFFLGKYLRIRGLSLRKKCFSIGGISKNCMISEAWVCKCISAFTS